LTVAQVQLFAEAEMRRMNRFQATALEGLMAGIGAMLDKSANKKVVAYLKKLRSNA